ncbi:hypothetical protein AB3G33_08950 [Flavobacterium sp. WC2421]|jgi:hypothetical protein|uniref:Uncharacterized protein n=3 Tax=unclassified Flavobacterium TaxID=196869 RepID=A0AB39W9N3_9FLAO
MAFDIIAGYVFCKTKNMQNSLMCFAIFLLFEFFKVNFVVLKKNRIYFHKSIALMEAASLAFLRGYSGQQEKAPKK